MTTGTTTGKVVAVCRNAEPGLPKPVVDEVKLIEDWGIEGDYHAGKFVRHRYLAKKYPTRRNLRQVCIVDASVFGELTEQNIQIGPGMMGENITVEGIDIMQLAVGTRLAIGEAQVEITEIRTPCKQLNAIDESLLKAVSHKEGGKKVYQAGMMARIVGGGVVREGDDIHPIY